MKRILLAVGIATSLAALPAAAFAAGGPQHPMSGAPCACLSKAQGTDGHHGLATAKPTAVIKASSNFTPEELTQIWNSP